ncbi:MAG TPA: NAD(P)/FAD-dependent oxidoreductase [Thermomicrobiales bacterium]|nr:NAD(P)/FAD-dependent oxidoreductase [Thermomicrobiales bacterium]
MSASTQGVSSDKSSSPAAAPVRTVDGRLPQVVIVGGGFGGLKAAAALTGQPVQITIIDRRNHFLFQPLLYQVAMGQLEPADIAQPIRALTRKQKNVRVLQAEVTSIDTEAKNVVLADETTLPYDYLVLATGSSHNYFGSDHFAPFAPGMKTMEDALEIRRRVFDAFEAAERTTDEEERKALLTFVVIGAGPTGVELAGSLAEITKQTLSDQFKSIDPAHAKVYLVEGLDRVLPPFPEELSKAAQKSLDQLGVQTKLKGFATNIDATGITIGKDPGEFIPARTIIWSAGVKASPLAGSLGVELDRPGRVLVEPDLSVPGHPEIFIVGDLAAAKSTDGKPVPGVAPAAMQTGTHAGKNIVHLIQGEKTQPFTYNNKGSMAIIARNKAVADIRGKYITGFPAWVMWLGVHVAFLPTLRNKVSTIFTWITSYPGNNRRSRAVPPAP